MTENPTGSRRVRAGDTDRDRVVATLQRHHEAGRLTAEEFQERMGAALAATWLDELPPLLADLPDDRAEEPAADGAPEASSCHRAAAWHGHRPGAPGAGWGQPRRGRGPWPFLPLLVLALVVAGSVAAVAHGHFPFPLLWLALIVLWFRPWWLFRRLGAPARTRR